MSHTKELQCYEYVNVDYETVRNALAKDTLGVLHRATATAAARAESTLAQLSVKLGPVEIASKITVVIVGHHERVSASGERTTNIELAWQAATSAALFPSMEATLAVYALSPTETQLDLHGRYTPPLGVLGSAANAVLGHRIAEAAVLKLVQALAARLSTELS